MSLTRQFLRILHIYEHEGVLCLSCKLHLCPLTHAHMKVKTSCSWFFCWVKTKLNNDQIKTNDQVKTTWIMVSYLLTSLCTSFCVYCTCCANLLWFYGECETHRNISLRYSCQEAAKLWKWMKWRTCHNLSEYRYALYFIILFHRKV